MDTATTSPIVLLSVSTLTVDGHPEACDVCGQTQWLRLVGAYGHGVMWCDRWHVTTRAAVTDELYTAWAELRRNHRIIEQELDAGPGAWARDVTPAACMQGSAS